MFTYYLMDGLTRVDYSDGNYVSYSYDNACRLTKVTTPFGSTSYEYDLLDRMTRVVDRNVYATVYEYDTNGNRTADFVVRAAARSLSFLFQYKLNTAVCQVPDAKYPDATERSAVRSGYFAAHQFSLSGYIISSSPSTLPQSRSGIVHFLDISVVAGYSALSSAVSLGNTLLCLFRRR